MMHDFSFILSWWWLLFVIGGALLPLTTVFFSAFRDKGYIFSKILSLAVLSYVSFTLGTLHLVPFGQISLIVILLVLYLINYWFLRPWKAIFNKGFLAIIFLEEALFLLVMSFWTFIRGFNPEVHGLEKYMDFGFMNSILRSTYFPPKDMWLTPYSINYYYFGHLYSAVLMKISGIPPATAFNLIVGMVAGLSFTACFSVGLNLLEPLKFRFRPLKLLLGGLLSAFLVTFAGNLHTIYLFFKPYENDHPVPPWQLQFSPSTFPNSYWYPNATRFIYNTIHEFPIYSWVVSDLHGHVLDIPFVLFTLALLYAFLLRPLTAQTKPGKRVSHHTTESSWALRISRPSVKKYIAQPSLWYLVLTGFFLAVMYMTNAWDGLIYMLLTGLVILVLTAQPIVGRQETLALKLRSLFSPEVILPTITSLIPVLAGFIIFSLPFSLFFKPFVSGIGILCAPSFLTKMGHLGPFLFEPNHCQKSPWWQLLILYGFFTFFSASLLIFLRNKEKTVSDKFVLMLIGLSYLLIIIPEFIYVKDIYPEHYRANTMFKLVFQSFIMLSLVSGYTILRILSNFKFSIPNFKWTKLGYPLFLIFSFALLALVFLYPYFAIMSYYNNLQSYLGIDGMAYLKNLYPTDFPAIQWLNTHVKGQPVILEAQGDSYTDYARVSANTGLPTVLGWTVHEWLWRGEYDYAPDDPKRTTDKTPYYPAPRIADVQTLYESTDLSATTGLLRKYNVQYVFLGDLERQKYANLNEDKWKMFGKVVYQDGQTKIYKLNLQ